MKLILLIVGQLVVGSSVIWLTAGGDWLFLIPWLVGWFMVDKYYNYDH